MQTIYSGDCWDDVDVSRDNTSSSGWREFLRENLEVHTLSTCLRPQNLIFIILTIFIIIYLFIY